MEEEFYSLSFLIRLDQHPIVHQLECVRAAAAMFDEYRERVADPRPRETRDLATFKMNVAAKAFVYEAASLRQIVAALPDRYPQFGPDVTAALAQFDTQIPLLSLLRNSQAHLDERLNFRARNRALPLKDDPLLDPHGFGYVFPPQVVGRTIQATVETGEHAIIAIGEATVQAAEQLVRRAFVKAAADHGPR